MQTLPYNPRVASESPMSASADSLLASSGVHILTCGQVILKAALESEVQFDLIAGPAASGFDDLLRLPQSGTVNELVRMHALRVVTTQEASRALTLADQQARRGRHAMALVPNSAAGPVSGLLSTIVNRPIERGGGCVLILEDHPLEVPVVLPRRLVTDLRIPALEPATLGDVYESVEQAIRLSRAAKVPAAIIVHHSLLHTLETLEVGSNRVLDPVQRPLVRPRRRRRPRRDDTGGVLRMVRRLELNESIAMPSPGERVPVGFIAIGPARGSILHLVRELKLQGRLPILALRVIQPVDAAVVERLLMRCQQVLVLEPRPGEVEAQIQRIAAQLRSTGQNPAVVWGQRIIPAAEQEPALAHVDGYLHPSVLARDALHLLHQIRPTEHVANRLVPDPPAQAVSVPPRGRGLGLSGARAAVQRLLADVDQWLREREPEEDDDVAPSALALEGVEGAGDAQRLVHVEMMDAVTFQRFGTAALRQIARDELPAILIILNMGAHDGQDIRRLVTGVIPAQHASKVDVLDGSLADRNTLRDRLRQAALVDRVTVLLIRDGTPGRFDMAAIEKSLEEPDRLGFAPRQRVVWPADEACSIRLASRGIRRSASTRDTMHDAMVSSVNFEPTVRTRSQRVRLAVQPLLEEVTVMRTQAPARSAGTRDESKLPLPQPIHAKAPVWRAHMAGYRGRDPGPVAQVLAEAGRRMGYAVRCHFNSTSIQNGWHAWAQVLFTRRHDDQELDDLTGIVPYGEADLILGYDPEETLRAIGPDVHLRVANIDRTCIVWNLAAERDDSDSIVPQTAQALESQTRSDQRCSLDFSSLARATFHTERVADLIMLGMAYQHGMIPLSFEAIEGALHVIEGRGYGRAEEAFTYGRYLAHDERPVVRPHAAHESLDQLIHRKRLTLKLGTRRQRARSDLFQTVVQHALDAMPSLGETDPGRQAQRDFVVAVHRCLMWGGLPLAERYAGLVTDLYLADRGDRGRSVTRDAILPLAQVLLIRDPIHVAVMVVSPEHRRRTRQTLNVKHSRDDVVERRFLTRLEAEVLSRRLRIDLRTSDWPAKLVASMRWLMPQSWRGSRRTRALRRVVVDFVEQAVEGMQRDYDRYAMTMRHLQEQASDDRLRSMAVSELQMLLQAALPVEPATDQADEPSPTSH
jgi:Pyruvate/2-oxoacid:ferredoxin oxidoreductase gamma subunit